MDKPFDLQTLYLQNKKIKNFLRSVLKHKTLAAFLGYVLLFQICHIYIGLF